MLGVGQSIFDIFYPIGSYYETSDTNFNPNTAHSWYGTWVEDTAGRVLVAVDSNQTEFTPVGKTAGNKYMQSHTHGFNSGTSNTYETIFITTVDGNQIGAYTGSYGYKGGYASIGYSGGGDSENLQPYVVIKRWHRTA